MRNYLIDFVLPAIKAVWPSDDGNKTIWIQQDNAPTHVPPNDQEFCRAVEQVGLDIRLRNQPANSPDLNALDLGFFASLQSLMYKLNSRNIDDLIGNVEMEYRSYDAIILNKVFLTLQGCMLEIMEIGGGNNYKIPHMNKDRLTALGDLPISLSCRRALLSRVMEKLDSSHTLVNESEI